MTADEIVSIPLFEGLPEAERERLSHVAADIPRRVGGQPGDEQALLTVLDGHVEVVKIFGGVPQGIVAPAYGRRLRRGADDARDASPRHVGD